MAETTYCRPIPRLAEFYSDDERDNPGYWICRVMLDPVGRHNCAVVARYTDDVIDAAAADMFAATGKRFSKAGASRYLRKDWTPDEKLAHAQAGRPQFIRDRFEAKGWTIQCGGGLVQVVPL